MKLSIVVPVYGCPEALQELYKQIIETVNKITKSYEIILVNDGCPKNSWNEIEKVCKKDKRVKGINLSRNFGQIHATNAGIDYSTGEYVVVMDCDLQDDPHAIIDLYKKVQEGFDIDFVKRKERKDSEMTKFLSKLFYKVYNSLVDGYYDSEVGNYCIVRKKVVDEYKNIEDNNKSFTTTICWMGFKTAYLEVEGRERYAGKSSYTLKRKIDLAIDMLTSLSNKPLKMLMKIGTIIATVGFVYLLIQLVVYIFTNTRVEGYMSIIASIFLMSGIILISLGGVGIYIGNIFNQTKGIPEYIVSEILNNEKQ